MYPPLDLYISSVAASPDGDRSAHERGGMQSVKGAAHAP